MSPHQDLLAEVVDLAQSVGLLNADGDLDTSWFDAPLTRTAQVFGDDGQRKALLDLLDAVLGQDPGARPRPGEQWYALLPGGPVGNFYLTVDDSAAGRTRVGVAGALHGPRGAGAGDVTADFVLRVPVLDATPSSVTMVLGQAGTPVQATLQVALHAADIDSLELTASLDASGVGTAVTVVLNEPSGPRALDLDPTALGDEAVDVILQLLQARLGDAGIPPAVARLPELLGIGTSDPMPLTGGTSAIQTWFARQCQGGAAAPIATTLLDVVNDLLGLTGVSGDGSADTPWLIQGAISANLLLGVAVWVSPAGPAGTPTLQVAVTFTGGAGPAAACDAEIVLLAVPLSGTGHAQLLPRADVRGRAPADPSAFLVGGAASDPRVGSLRAGFRWDGTALGPLLELLDVAFEGVEHQRVDLLDGTSVVNAASAALEAAIRAAVGSSPTANALLALAGISQPPGGAGYPQADIAAFAANPLREIARVHRAVLADPAHPWSGMLGALATLAGAPAPVSVSGTGTTIDPWRVALVAAGPLALELVASQAGAGTPGADALLAIGLRVGVDSAPWHAGVVVDLLTFDLPGDGTAASIALVGGVHVVASGSPLGQSELASVSGATLTVGADAMSLGLDWRAGAPMSGHAELTNVAVSSSDGTSVVVPTMSYSSLTASGAVPGNPLAGFGISQQQALDLTRMLLARAGFAWGGATGYALLGLLGVHRDLAGLGDGMPLLGQAATVFDAPVAALREQLRGITTGLNSDGSSVLEDWSLWLAALLRGNLPAVAGARPPAGGRAQAAGTGTYADPWAVPLVGNVELLGWFEPSGPPAAWAAAAATELSGAVTAFDVVDAVRRLAAFDPALADAMTARDVGLTADNLAALAAFLTSSDGVVELVAQQPDPVVSPGWALGTEVHAAHHLLPRDGDVISQLRAQLTAWSPGAVLLVGPPFGSHADWSDLLTAAGVAPASVPNVDFRQPGVEPEGVDVEALTTVAAWYTADLADDGAADPVRVVAQIQRMVERIGTLHGEGSAVAIVAHSTAGVPARLFVSTAPAGSVAGLITVGSPLRGATLKPVVDPLAADALRYVLTCLDVAGGALGNTQVQAAVDHLRGALDGFQPGPPGTPPTASPYPVGAFVRTTTDLALGGVPALAIGGRLDSDLVGLLAAAVAQVVQQRASAATDPTHLGLGWRTALGLPDTSPDAVAVDAWLRVDAGRVQLTAAPAPESPRPAQSARAQIRLSRPAGWLAGSPTTFTGLGLPMVEARARWAELGLAITPDGSGGVACTPYATVADGSVRGVPVTGALGSPDLASGLGAVFQALSVPPPAAGGRLDAVLDALAALGLVARDASGSADLAADAVTSLLVDAKGYLTARFQAAIAAAGGWAGLAGPAGGPFSVDLGGGLSLGLTTGPWQVTLSSSAGGLALGPLGLQLTASLGWPGFDQQLHVETALGRIVLTLDQPGGRLHVSAPPWVDGLDLLPIGTGTAQQSARDELLPRLALSSAVSAMLEQAVGLSGVVGPIDGLLAGAGQWLGGPGAFGSSGTGGLDGAKVGALLTALGRVVPGSSGTGLPLPGGLTVTAAGNDPLVVTVATDPAAPLLGTVGFSLGLAIDAARHATPTGSVSVAVPLGGGWPSATVVVEATGAGVRLAVAPAGQPPIELLPRFSGFGALAAAASALLPALLDTIHNEYSPPGVVHQGALDLATALDLYDAAGGFAAHADTWAAMVRAGWIDSVAGAARTTAVAAAADVLTQIGVPGALTASGASVQWTTGVLSVRAGWGTGSPELLVTCTDLAVAGTPVHLWLTAAVSAGSGGPVVTADATAVLDATADVGFAFTPGVRVSLDTSGPGGVVRARLLPLGRAAEGALAVNLVPSFAIAPTPAAVGELVSAWLVPIAGAMTLGTADVQTLLGHPLWAGGPTTRDVLQRAGVMTGSALAAPLPALSALPGLVTRALAQSAHLPPVTVAAGLTVALVSDGPRFGLRIAGSHDVDAGDVTVALHFGGTETWNGGTDAGLTLYLFDLASTIQFHPGLHAVGVGLGIEGADGGLLVSTDNVVLGSVDGYLSFDIDPRATAVFSFVAAGAELVKAGLPLGLLGGAGSVSSNPVAASLLSGGGTATSGDQQGVNPTVDVAVYYRGNHVTVDFGGTSGPLWIGVHRQFGPIYIDQVGVNVLDGPVLSLLVDGGAHVGPLTVQVDDLELDIPVARLAEPDQWGLDLKGLAVAFDRDPVAIAGGLVKYPGPPVQYNGMLVASIADLGVAAVGSFAQPADAQGGFTSLFVFAALGYPLGGPAWLFITGLGGGAGYNRELIAPQSVDDVPNFVLVSAIDDNSLANDPMNALSQIGPNMPPKRGAFWLAAGLRFTTFVVVKTTAVVYVALDRGVTVGVLGVSRMALPDENTAVVSVELALAARYSTEEKLLSVQAQLTDNSWLFTQDCQLTGGFAFFMWFSEAQFVLTMGGYHPSFQRPDNFPVVPRLGFNWRVDDTIVIKGEAYFALTNTCVMLGGRLEAVFDSGAIRAWFIAYADVLIAWDPFQYDVAVGVSVGVSATVKVCFIGCVRVSISVSVGAQLHLAGPPLHGSVGIDYWVLSFTIPFGDEPRDQPQLSWPQFMDKYLIAGDPSGAATSTRVAAGLLPPDPAGAPAAAGTSGQPWKVGAEYTFAVATRLAAERWIDFLSATEHSDPDVGDIDIAPMGASAGNATTVLSLAVTTAAGGAVATSADHWTIRPSVGPVPEATWRHFDTVPAAARNITAITGASVEGRAVATGRSELIAIQKLVDDQPQYAHPLPFTPSLGVDLTLVRAWGAGATQLVAVTADAGTSTVLDASTALLTGAATDQDFRVGLGLPPESAPAAVSQVRRRRSAPPLIAPLATGMTLEAVPARPAPTYTHPADVLPELLDAPRLRGVLRDQPQATTVTRVAARTSVRSVQAAAGVPRSAPPAGPGTATGAPVLGGSLLRVAAPATASVTRAAATARTSRNLDLGVAASVAELNAFGAAAASAVGNGVPLAAGETHVWDLPPAWAAGQVELSGPASTVVRVTAWNRAGGVLADTQQVLGDGVTPVGLAGPVRHVAVTCLGTAPGAGTAAALAPPGRIAATGWQSGSRVLQVTPHTALCRGGWLTVSTPATSRRRQASRPLALARAADVVRGSLVVETVLPADSQVVGVLIDLTDVAAADGGDLVVAVDGGTCGPPVEVAGRRQRLLLYDVKTRQKGADHLAVTVGSGRGWTLSGVVALPGQATEWSTRFSTSIPDDLVPDGPLTDGGACVVRLVPGGTGGNGDG